MKKLLQSIAIIGTMILSFASCTEATVEADTLSFSKAIYILPATADLEVELVVSKAPATDLAVGFEISGNAVQDEEYAISAELFVIKAGETKATVTISPLVNITADKKITLSLSPVEGYALGNIAKTDIAVEVKEKIMYSLTKSYNQLLSTVELCVELKGEQSGDDFVAASDIHIPFELVDGTAWKGVDYEVEDGATEFVILKGKRKDYIKVKSIEKDAADETSDGKTFSIKLQTPTEYADLYFLGDNAEASIVISDFVFSSIVGKWKPVTCETVDILMLLGEPESVFEGIPQTFDDSEYLEFVSDDESDRIIPHVTTGLEAYFCGEEHTLVYDHVDAGQYGNGIYNWNTDEYMFLPYFIIHDVNTLFAKSAQEIGDVFISFRVIDENTITVHFNEYTPTDFLVSTFEEFGGYFDVEIFGLVYQFTRVIE